RGPFPESKGRNARSAIAIKSNLQNRKRNKQADQQTVERAMAVAATTPGFACRAHQIITANAHPLPPPGGHSKRLARRAISDHSQNQFAICLGQNKQRINKQSSERGSRRLLRLGPSIGRGTA